MKSLGLVVMFLVALVLVLVSVAPPAASASPAYGMPAGRLLSNPVDCYKQAQPCMKVCMDTYATCQKKCGTSGSAAAMQCATACGNDFNGCNAVCLKPCSPTLDGG